MKPTRDHTFMRIAEVMSLRATCKRGKVGSVIVKDGRIISAGYNGSPPGMPECLDVGCIVEDYKRWDGDKSDYVTVPTGCQRAVHAEANAIVWAARHGLPVEGATLYCTHGPCPHCAQLIATAGIIRVVFDTPYRLSQGLDLLDRVGIPYEEFSGV